MSKLTSTQLRTLREMLTDEKSELEKHFEINEQTATGMEESLRASTSELFAVDNHPADVGTELFERERDLAVNENIVEQLGEIKRALVKMNDTRYGVCETCGEDIPYARLEAIPYTAYCVEHAAAQGSGVSEGVG
jgi:DnaK suppressor protein